MTRTFHSRWASDLERFIQFRQTYYKSPYPRDRLLQFDHCAADHPGLPLDQAVNRWLTRNQNLLPRTRKEPTSPQ